MQPTIQRPILWILILDYPWPRGRVKIKTKPFNIFLLQINTSINSLSMTTIISGRSIAAHMKLQGRRLSCQLKGRKKKKKQGKRFCSTFLQFNFFRLLLWVWNAIFSRCCHINISRCFSLSLLVKRAGDLLKILLYLFQESSSVGRRIDWRLFFFFSFF